ncbi:hypothetical protein P3T76_008099 [Phytophthora citrophthora]|uniref:Uncharacterized protein n=1 Tax=Phytophthora citrophthora TaxID=4793 RepID=A0AAD9GLX1_9STRA|nr:hypothetical protein P3T76_008099 [Phytophthora citrophthora]
MKCWLGVRAADIETHLNAVSKILASHYQDQIDALESEKSALEERLEDSKAEVWQLKARPTTTATDSWGFSEFLFEHGELNGSWVRLRKLLVQFQEGQTPLEDWDTIINVTAMDERKVSMPDFHKRLTKIRFDQAAEAKKAARVLDLTRTGSGVAVSGGHTGESKKSGAARLVIKPMSPTKSTKSSGFLPLKPTRSSGKHRVRVVQDRPKNYTPGIDTVRPANAKSLVSRDAVHTMLPDRVVWEEVRPDLRLALLAGISYETAMKWLRTDKSAHSLFTGRPLVQMLVSMVYWRKLNQTPWTSYVPLTYYKMADEELRRLQKNDVEPPACEALDAHGPDPIIEPESTEDDPQKDPDFKASGEQESASGDEESSDEGFGNSSSASDDKGSDDHSHAGAKCPRDYESSDTDDSGPSGAVFMRQPYPRQSVKCPVALPSRVPRTRSSRIASRARVLQASALLVRFGSRA